MIIDAAFVCYDLGVCDQPAARFMCEEDFEFAALKEHKCPFSRVQQLGDYGPL